MEDKSGRISGIIGMQIYRRRLPNKNVLREKRQYPASMSQSIAIKVCQPVYRLYSVPLVAVVARIVLLTFTVSPPAVWTVLAAHILMLILHH